MKIRCSACMKELDDEVLKNATIFPMDNGEDKHFCEDKKCQKQIEQIVTTFHYTHTMERGGRMYYIIDPEFYKYTNDGSSLYKMTVFYKMVRIGSVDAQYFTDKFVWETGNVLTIADDMKEEEGTLYIDKIRVKKH